MIEVRIPAALRDDAQGRATIAVDASGACTVAAVLNLLFAQYPRLRARVLDDTGAVRRFVNVFVDDVELARSLDTAVSDGATVYIFHSIAGGAM